MSKNKLISLIKAYKYYFKLCNYSSIQFPIDRLVMFDRVNLMQHCYYMVLEMEKFIDKDIEKAHRWLGFIQGCFWSIGKSSIEELRQLNMSYE